MDSVTENLEEKGEFFSDQGEVWHEIAHIYMKTDVKSSTGAMRDIFVARKEDLKGYLSSFECQPGQKGLLVFINGEVVGFDMVSLEPAYRDLHTKLLKSYALEAQIVKNKVNEKPFLEKAKAFIKEALKCKKGSSNRWGMVGIIDIREKR